MRVTKETLAVSVVVRSHQDRGGTVWLGSPPCRRGETDPCLTRDIPSMDTLSSRPSEAGGVHPANSKKAGNARGLHAIRQ
jgi:hypothetical protein